MRPTVIQLLALAISTTMAVPLVTATGAEANNRHLRKHHQQASRDWNASLRRSWAADEVRPVVPAPSGAGDVCPGNARAIDCKIWPPPIIDDPDRRSGGGDGM